MCEETEGKDEGEEEVGEKEKEEVEEDERILEGQGANRCSEAVTGSVNDNEDVLGDQGSEKKKKKKEKKKRFSVTKAVSDGSREDFRKQILLFRDELRRIRFTLLSPTLPAYTTPIRPDRPPPPKGEPPLLEEEAGDIGEKASGEEGK